MFPIDPMAILAITHDVPLTRLETGWNVRQPAIYVCENCSCVFWPDDDGGGNVYIDRYTHIADDGTRSDQDDPCGCHEFPYSTYDSETDSFVVSRVKDSA